MRTVTHGRGWRTDSGSFWGRALGLPGLKLLPATGTLLSLCWDGLEDARVDGEAGPEWQASHRQASSWLVTGHGDSEPREQWVIVIDLESSLHRADFRSRWLVSHTAGFPGRPVL